MQSKKFITKNGKKEVIINESKMKQQLKLKNAVEKSLIKSTIDTGVNFGELLKKIKTEIKKGTDISNLTLNDLLGLSSKFIKLDTLIFSILTVFINIDTSDEFYDCINECLKFSLYDGSPITLEMFDDNPSAKEDYYEILFSCLEVNLTPFIKSLFSMFVINQ